MNELINWHEVLPMFGIESRYLNNQHKPCPICGGTDRFRFDNRDNSGSFFCSHCGAGSGLRLIRLKTGLQTREIFRCLKDRLPINNNYIFNNKISASEESIHQNMNSRRGFLERLWQVAKQLKPNDSVDKYLSNRVSRFNYSLLSDHIRCHSAMCYFEHHNDSTEVQTYCCMLSRVVNEYGELVNLHRTYLTADGQKAPVKSVKKLMKGVCRLNGSAIRIYETMKSRTLGVCEGIETGIALLTALKGSINIWSAVNCANLAALKLPRSRFDRVVIFADHDQKKGYQNRAAGLFYAKKLAKSLNDQHIAVDIFMPEFPGDFLDVFLQKGQLSAIKLC